MLRNIYVHHCHVWKQNSQHVMSKAVYEIILKSDISLGGGADRKISDIGQHGRKFSVCLWSHCYNIGIWDNQNYVTDKIDLCS